MKRAVANTNNITVADLIQQARHYVIHITGNPHFPSPNPPLADVTLIINRLEKSNLDSKAGNHAAVAEKRTLYKELVQMISFLVSYINSIAKGDEQIILSAGMKTNKDREISNLLPAPGDVHLSDGYHQGEVIVRFNRVPKAKFYVIHFCEHNVEKVIQTNDGKTQLKAVIDLPINLEDLPWKIIDNSTKTKHLISGLTVGKNILVRVAASNKLGRGSWSDIAPLLVR